MIRSTLIDLCERAKALAGFGASEIGNETIKGFLKHADSLYATQVEAAQASISWTTVADQDEYRLPIDFYKALLVTYDGKQLEHIGWNEYQRYTSDGQATDSTTPRCFMVIGNKLKLVKPPDDDLTLVLKYVRSPIQQVRDIVGVVGSGPTTTTVVVAQVKTDLGEIDNNNTTSAFFNDCVLEVNRNGTKIRSEITNYNESTGTFTVSPAYSATPVAADKVRVLDVLLLPESWSTLACSFAAGQICLASKDPKIRALASAHISTFEREIRRARSDARRRVRGAGRVFVRGSH